MVGARFQGRQLQSCVFRFLSLPTTESSKQVIVNSVPTHHRPFVQVLALDSQPAPPPAHLQGAHHMPHPSWQGAS